MFSVLTVNGYVQLGLLIIKCLLDYTYFELVTYLRPHFCANDVYMAVRRIMMHLICLLSVSSPC
jgi:hypothetical protein